MVTLQLLKDNDIEQFIDDCQYAFKYGISVDTYTRDHNLDDDDEIIPRNAIINSLENGIAYRICEKDKAVGGIIVKIDQETHHNKLLIMFVSPSKNSRGVGTEAWRLVEKTFPETISWETRALCFETRNPHFFVNKLGFHIVEYFGPFHPDPDEDDDFSMEIPKEIFKMIKIVGNSELEDKKKKK